MAFFLLGCCCTNAFPSHLFTHTFSSYCFQQLTFMGFQLFCLFNNHLYEQCHFDKENDFMSKKTNRNRFVSLMNCFRFDALFPCHCVLIFFFVSLDAILLKAPLDPHELFHLISKSIHNRRISFK